MSIIGITTYRETDPYRYYLPGPYVDGVRRAGGVPLLLPPGELEIEQILKTIDGLILAGGGDIDPVEYGGDEHPSIERVDRVRDAFEITLAREVLQTALPVLGICRGLQIFATATGGDLITHIPEEIATGISHKAGPGKSVLHSVRIEPDSRLYEITETLVLSVESMHHQGVKHIPPEWRVVAKAEDGIIEALEHRSKDWKIAVLWHPELSLNDPGNQRIFNALVAAAGKK